MTSDMAFECLFVSRDGGLFRTLGRILRELSISTSICLSASTAFELLGKGSTDLIVIDWEDAECPELMGRLWKGGKWRKPTVVAISSSDPPLPGAHVVLKKPVTAESGAKSFKDAYSRMMLDYRRYARQALMSPVIATLEDGRAMSVTVTDIGDGGVGLSSKEKLVTGDVLSFRLRLPGAREILVQVRVLWTREYGRAGCEFLRIPPVDLVILHDWLKAKCQVKKPLIAG
ncbi:hypothetical protein SBA1_800008 [Candidatus Sulfotelmatobacter kueseliae]|uniref:PilZ domain-containing protein n=1 Tax=Candidatus Sulfotelmatobacter kueseliae TaxID=2042962 RepID=A0A2U3L832_9BACT|nr:hypothetical protein SBA1_800008 [Candidatus Sulfotelmatobacter kueseliae]